MIYKTYESNEPHLALQVGHRLCLEEVGRQLGISGPRELPRVERLDRQDLVLPHSAKQSRLRTINETPLLLTQRVLRNGVLPVARM